MPTLFTYKEGEVKGSIVGLTTLGGTKVTPDSEWPHDALACSLAWPRLCLCASLSDSSLAGQLKQNMARRLEKNCLPAYLQSWSGCSPSRACCRRSWRRTRATSAAVAADLAVVVAVVVGWRAPISGGGGEGEDMTTTMRMFTATATDNSSGLLARLQL